MKQITRNGSNRRKSSSDDDGAGGGGGGGGGGKEATEDDDENVAVSFSIPLPIQTFLWRQTSPFIRPKISRLQDAAAMEQREACKLFEKVLVQNIRFGLSPSLSEAINSVSRWRLIVAALPHVMHCCSALLYARRKSSFDKLSASETKLLYTLHWILLDAAEECADEEIERGIHRSPEHYLLPVSTIQTFVYLFAPLIPHLKKSDFLTSFRLENGYKIWTPLFEYCHPEIPSFVALATKNTFSLSRTKIVVPKFGDVFIGSDQKQSQQQQQKNDLERKASYEMFAPPPESPIASATTVAPFQDPISSSTATSIPKKKYEFVKKDLEPSLATYLDVAVVRCLFTSQWIEDGIDWALNYILRRIEYIYRNRDNENRFRFRRSKSLPAPRRRLIDTDIESVMDNIKQNNNRPTNQDEILADGFIDTEHPDGSQQQQLKTFSEARRSSFSGLPGLSGFQALISSTTSSASFGRHGSEKVKPQQHHQHHAKKQQKQKQITASHVNQPPLSVSGQNRHHFGPKSESSSSKLPLNLFNKNHHHYHHQDHSKIRSKMKTAIDSSKYQIGEHTTIQQHHHELRVRPSSAAASTVNDELKYDGFRRKVSLSDTQRLIDRDDLKGKSMPTLHLISSISDKEDQSENQQQKNPFICLNADVPRTPSRTSLVEMAITGRGSGGHHQFPIITITEHSPVHSLNFFGNDQRKRSLEPSSSTAATSPSKYKFYIDDDDRQQQQPSASSTAANYHHHHPHQYHHHGLLARSKSDTLINYSIETGNESLASINYVNKNGQLSLVVILKAIHSITLKDTVCSIRICRLIHKIINKLIDYKLISKRMATIYTAKKYKTFKPNSENPELSVHHLFMDTLFRIVKQLGCSRGCGEGRRELEAIRLKENVMKTLKHLHEISESHFMQYCEMLVTSHPVQEIMDIFHAFFGFCAETTTTTNQAIFSVVKKPPLTGPSLSSGGSGLANLKNGGYSNNFGAGFPPPAAPAANASKVKLEVDTIIVTCTFKPFISRLVFIQKELKVQENMSLYCEVRQYISYVRDHHGGIFRNAALCGLIESTKFVMHNEKMAAQAKTTASTNMAMDQSSSLRSGEILIIKDLDDSRLSLSAMKKPFKAVATVASVGLRTPRTSGLMDGSDHHHHHYHRNASTSDLQSNEQWSSLMITDGTENIEPKISTASAPGLQDGSGGGAGTGDQESASLQNYLQITESNNNSEKLLIRRGSFNRQTLKGGGGFGAATTSGGPNFVMGMNQKSTFFKARKRMDQKFKNVFGKNKVKQNSFDETPEISRKNSLDLDQRLHSQRHQRPDSSGIGPELPLKKSRTILFEILKDGMLKFQFLLDSCTPGTIPDAQLVAAMLDLKAPVLARAAFLLECSHFVHRCNRGQWPGWMRMNFNFFRPSGPTLPPGAHQSGGGGGGCTRSGSQSVVKSRASTTLQRVAGRCFFQWGELLSSRLEDILQSDIDQFQSSITTTASNTAADESRSYDDEDFFSVSETKEGNCPFGLKIIACQLLYEITTYLRETQQYLLTKSSRRTSVVATNSGGGTTATAMAASALASVKERTLEPPKPLMHNNRRWSMAFSNANLKDSSTHSMMSLANLGPGPSVHLLEHCTVPPNERRISFVLHEAEVENDSNSFDSTEETQSGHNLDRKRLSQAALPWRSSGGHADSFRRRSIKLKKDKKSSGGKLRSATLVEDDYKSMFKRSNSLRSKRKVSAASERSDTSDRFSGEDSPGLISEEAHSFESMMVDSMDTSDTEMIENIPWLKITTLFSSAINFDCTHQQSCPANCHKKVIQSASVLTKEVQRVYERDIQPLFDFEFMAQKLLDDKEDVAKKEKKLKKILMGHTSPLKRKASNLHVDKYVDRDHRDVYNSQTALTGTAHTVDLEFGGCYETEDPRLIFYDVLNYRMESKQEENTTMLYILNQVKNPFHSIISMMLKSALILNRSQFEYLLDISWNLILDEDIQISSSASVAIIVCSLKCPDLVVCLLNKDLNHQNVDIRVSAINKYLKIWCNRYQCWQRLEEGAHLVLKLPPAAIEFTLPSPRIALECKPVVDPPYMPIVKTKVDEVAINQEPSIQKSFVAATKTRRKQQIELISKALQDQEDKLREERENYRFTTIPWTLQAAYEPVLYHTIDDHDETEDDVERIPLHHLQVAQCFFPSSLTTASFLIVNLMEDTQINSEGYAVYDVAYRTILHCLIEDSSLFLRNLLEKLTREKKNIVIQTIRRLIRFVPRLPSQAAFTLYNYLIGFIMYHVRTPGEESQEIIASVMSILWLIVPNVYGLFLKDLKQILRKEQCDATILVTANVPSAKKIIVHGPDPGSIPSQFPVHEDTQFAQILTDSLDFFGIDESKHNEYFLVDTKTNQIHNLNAFVRDFYFFKRSQYPQISLVHMNPIEAYDKFQRQAFTLQFTELGKTLMTLSLIKTSFLGIQRVLFLHEELMKLPSFPRKALETNLTLYTGPMGREVLGIDTLHKISWVKLVSRMFEATSGFFADSSDIHLFLNVVNGTLLLHCEDASILRLCMATYINAAHQFKNIFATNGYLLIVQTIVQIYGTHQTNSLLCRTIEFVFKQFYILHSKPFVLQMFGAVAPLLDTDPKARYETVCQIQPKAFFQLLQSLGQYTADPLDILELVDAEKPLKALDFCYQMDSETLTILDAISLCVTVISYAPDSERGHQMLTILDSILPFHLMHMQTLTTKKETPGGPRAELSMIHSISVCIKTLIYNCEALTRNFTGPQRALDIRETSIKNTSPQFEVDEDSHSKYIPDSYYPPRHNRVEMDDGELCRLEFRKPRDLLLKIVSEFLTKSTTRFAELSKKVGEIHTKSSSYELLDVKCHIRLAEIAHSLLKLAPYDPQTMACKGLVRYMNEILPNSEWRQEQMRPALIMVLRRLDKTFAKISKKSAIKRTTDWEAARRLLKGVYLTFVKHPYIVHLPHLKSLINVCQNIILGDQGSYMSDSSSAVSSWTAALSQAPPPGFTSVAVRLISLQMLQLGDSQSLETICSGAFSSPEKSEIYLMNMIYPMCIRITSGMKDIPKFRQCDINFVLNVILNILKPAGTKSGKGSDSSSQAGAQLKQFSLQQIGFLGLKILITCFEKQLNTEWYHISKCIRDLADKPHLIGSTFWNFIDFISTYRTPLFVLMLPYIKCKYLLKTCDSEIEQVYRMRIQEKLAGAGMPLNRSKGNLYVSLVNEMKSLREDIIRRKNNPHLDERSKSIIQQEPNSASDRQENSGGGGGHRLSFALSQLASASKLSNVGGQPSTGSGMAGSVQAGGSHQDIQSTSSPTATGGSTARPRMLRGLSFRLNSDSRRLASRGLSVKLASNQSDKRMFTRRTSYPDHPDLEKLDLSKYPTGSEPKLFRKPTVHPKLGTQHQQQSLKSNSKSSIAFSGETLNEIDQRKDSFGKEEFQMKQQQQQQQQRIQRQRSAGRKSFRFKKSSDDSGKSTENSDEMKHVVNESSVSSGVAATSSSKSTNMEPSQQLYNCDNVKTMTITLELNNNNPETNNNDTTATGTSTEQTTGTAAPPSEPAAPPGELISPMFEPATINAIPFVDEDSNG